MDFQNNQVRYFSYFPHTDGALTSWNLKAVLYIRQGDGRVFGRSHHALDQSSLQFANWQSLQCFVLSHESVEISNHAFRGIRQATTFCFCLTNIFARNGIEVSASLAEVFLHVWPLVWDILESVLL